MIIIKRKWTIVGILIIAGIMSGVLIGLAMVESPQLDPIIPILIYTEQQKASSISIAGVPDQNGGIGISYFLDITPYISSPYVPISALVLFTNHTSSEVTVFNHNKTLKFYSDDDINFGLRISITYFGVVASDIIQVSLTK